MLPEERRRASIGEFGLGVVVMFAADAREGLVHFWIDADGRQPIGFEPVGDLFPRLF